jgi:hypothetical protein
MRPLRITALLLAFACAAAGFAPAGAAAEEAPEFGRCLSSATGSYSGESCLLAGSTNSWEWFPAFGANAKGEEQPLAKKRFTLVEGRRSEDLLVETVGGTKVKCGSQSGTGEFTGAKTLTVRMRFNGCGLVGGPPHCHNVEGTSEVLTSQLEGRLGVVQRGRARSKDVIGMVLFPTSGPWAAFECEGTPVELTGSVIVKMKTNKMLKILPLKFSSKEGRQTPQKFAHEAVEVLFAKIGSAEPEQSGLNLNTGIHAEEKLEVNSVL